MTTISNKALNRNNWSWLKRDWSLVKGWLEYSPELIQKIKDADTNHYERIRDFIKDYARISTAIERITDLEVEANKDYSEAKSIVTIIVTVIGSVFYARGSYILFSVLGELALFPALIVGLVASFAVDWMATCSISNRLSSLHKKQVVEQAKHRFSNLSKEPEQEISELKKYFHEQKIFYINDTENIAIKIKGFPSNTLIAMILNIIEYVSALFVINQVFASALEIPLYLQMILGLLPVTLTWGIANMKAQSFGLIDYYKKSIKHYEKELRLPFNEEEEEDWLEDQEYEEQKLNRGIQILLRETINENIPTAYAAEYLFEHTCKQEQKLTFEYRQQQEILQLDQEYQNDKAEVDEHWAREITTRIGRMRSDINEQLNKIESNSDPDIKKNNINKFYKFISDPNFDKVQKNIINECQKEREKEIQKLDEKLDLKIEKVQSKYKPMIKAYEDESKEAYENYKQECEQYKKREKENKRQADQENNNTQELWELRKKIDEQFRYDIYNKESDKNARKELDEDVMAKLYAALNKAKKTPPIDGERFVNKILNRFD